MGTGGRTQEKTLQVNLKRPSCLLNRRGLKAMEQTAVERTELGSVSGSYQDIDDTSSEVFEH